MNYHLSKIIAWQEMPSKEYVFIRNCKNDYLYRLDGVSKDIWMRIVNDKKVNEIVEDLEKEYAVDKSKLYRDVDDFISSLISEGILVH